MTHLLLLVIYLAFIGLGLPDSLLGSAWPSMYAWFGVPVSYVGILSMTIAAGTILSSLQSGRLSRRFHTGCITAVSVAMTAAAILGFSFSRSFWALWLWAIPYGLGAGSIDAALNNYVALHYSSRHMSWLHCMWGIGTILGPNIISYVLTNGGTGDRAYRIMAFLQMRLTAILVISLPLWRRKQLPLEDPEPAAEPTSHSKAEEAERPASALSLTGILHIPGAKEVMATFFCYCAVEQTAMLWAGSYLTLHNGISADAAAGYASMFFIGITVGRGINGFLTYRFTDTQMIRLGQGILAFGIFVMLLPFGSPASISGLILIGLGCAPIYPCVIHATPAHFGKRNSQALIGVQMASAYVGTCLMPPLFGIIAGNITVSLLPWYLLLLLFLMAAMHEMLLKKTASGAHSAF